MPDTTKLVVLGVLTLGLYAPVLRGLLRDWWSDANYSHGFLIPAVSGYLVWARWELMAGLPARPANTGLAVVIAALLLLAAGALGSELFLQRVSLVVLLTGMVLYLSGFAHCRRLLFPLGLLLLMIPLPAVIMYQITFPLQLLASRLAAQTIRWAEVPVLREGNMIYLAQTSFQVVEACSGMRSLFTLITVGCVTAHFTQTSSWARLLLVASAVPIALVANAARLTGTALLAHHFGAGAADGFFHHFSGWLLVLLACLLLFLEAAVLARGAGRPADPNPLKESSSIHRGRTAEGGGHE